MAILLNLDKFKNKRSVELSRKYRESFVDEGKICSKCKNIKPLDQYNKRPGGVTANCKKCIKKYNKKRHAKTKKQLW